MNKDLKRVFVAVKDNYVVAFDTNLKGFIEQMTELEPGIRNYAHYRRQFEKESRIEFPSESGTYYFQQIVI